MSLKINRNPYIYTEICGDCSIDSFVNYRTVILHGDPITIVAWCLVIVNLAGDGNKCFFL